MKRAHTVVSAPQRHDLVVALLETAGTAIRFSSGFCLLLLATCAFAVFALIFFALFLRSTKYWLDFPQWSGVYSVETLIAIGCLFGAFVFFKLAGGGMSLMEGVLTTWTRGIGQRNSRSTSGASYACTAAPSGEPTAPAQE
jgi:hypothetical protein